MNASQPSVTTHKISFSITWQLVIPSTLEKNHLFIPTTKNIYPDIHKLP